MKIVGIRPVKKPKTFSNMKFLKVDWVKADILGPLEVPYPTAIEAIRNSKGLYEFVPEAIVDAAQIVSTLKSPDEMSGLELAQEMTAFGKPPQKKMNRSKAVEFVISLREKAASMIVDDDDE